MSRLNDLLKDVNYQEAMEWLKQNNAKNALLGFEKTVQANPGHYIAWNNMGFLLYNTQRFIREAEMAFKKALEIEPNFIDAHINLFYLYIANNRVQDAKASLEAVKALDPKNPDLVLMEKKLA
jgi:Tfp pilus assembly protein PilF